MCGPSPVILKLKIDEAKDAEHLIQWLGKPKEKTRQIVIAHADCQKCLLCTDGNGCLLMAEDVFGQVDAYSVHEPNWSSGQKIDQVQQLLKGVKQDDTEVIHLIFLDTTLYGNNEKYETGFKCIMDSLFQTAKDLNVKVKMVMWDHHSGTFEAFEEEMKQYLKDGKPAQLQDVFMVSTNDLIPTSGELAFIGKKMSKISKDEVLVGLITAYSDVILSHDPVDVPKVWNHFKEEMGENEKTFEENILDAVTAFDESLSLIHI